MSFQIQDEERGGDGIEQQKVGNGSIFHFTKVEDVKYIIPAIITTTLTALTSPVLTLLLGGIFSALGDYNRNDLTPNEFMRSVLLYAIGIFSLGIGTVVLSWMMLTFWSLYANRQSQRARSIVFSSMVYKDLAWFDMASNVMGSLTMANRNVEDLRIATSVSLAFIVQAIVSIVASFTLAMYMSWSLTLVSLAGLPLVVLIAYLTTKPINKNLAKNKKAFESASSIMNWAIASVETVKLFNAQKVELASFKKQTSLSYKFYVLFANFMQLQQGFSRFLVLAMFVQGFFYGSHLVRKGEIPSGNVMTVFWCCISVAEHFHALSPQMILIGKGQAAVDSLKNIIDPGMDESVKFKRTIGLYPSKAEGGIVLKNVSSFFS
jgi:ATP-binding cassette subfamily B (MDR/TAP) protein 1